MDPYESKFSEMQKYMPFLQKMIAKLKYNNNNHPLDNPRRTHLQKMEMLFELLSNKDKKLKMETLLKCENVLIKLQSKIENKGALRPSMAKSLEKCKMLSKDKMLDLTGPESPPPLEKCIEETVQPVEIPTERRCSPILINDTNVNICNKKSYSCNRSLLKKSFTAQSNRYDRAHCCDLNHNNDRDANHIHSCNSQQKEFKKNHQHRKDYPRRRDSISSKCSLGSSNFVKHLSRTSHIPYKLFSCTTVNTTNLQDTKIVEDSGAYSPQELWDEYSKNQISKSRSKCISKYKWINNASQNVFSCLDANNRDNNLVKSNSSSSMSISVPARVTPIPEVLKSPPLTANDINNLLNETSGDTFNDSISEIGTRRSVKPETKFSHNDSMVSSLDFVRKKFAMITKMNTMNSRNSSAPSEGIDNPINPLPLSQNERLALKYNPHPRVDCNHTLAPNNMAYPFNKFNDSSKLINTPQHSVNNVNVLPTINLNDPRLKRINNGSPHNTSTTSKITSKSPLLPNPPNTINIFPELGKNTKPYKNRSPSRLFNTYNWSKEVEKVQMSTTISKKISRCNIAEYILEENLDSEPEAISSTKKFNKSVNSEVESFQNVYHGNKIFEGASTFYLASSTNNRFNALLNDKSEREKYFESKKIKDNEPKTYKEFREAKAKAEASAKEKLFIKSTMPNDSINKNESNIISSNQVMKKESKQITCEDRNINFGKFESSKYHNLNKDSYLKKKEKSIVASKNSLASTALDKMYRTQTFSNTDITINNKRFKIPKKKSEDLIDENYKAINQIKADANKAKGTSERIATNKKADNDHEMEKNARAESIKTEIIEKDNKVADKVQNKSPVKNVNKTNLLSLFDEKENPVTLDTLNIDCTMINTEKTNIETTADNLTFLNTAITTKRTSIENLQKSSKSVGTTVTPDVSNTVSKPEMVSSEKVKPFVQKKKVIFAKQQIENVKEVQDNIKPPRTLKRRCSMIAHGSAPEVDKQKLMRTNALLFEDVQDRQRQKIESRRSRNLEGIFQKTDDNCCVSTQNIIMGKRRTRATINFNETQNVKALFNYKTTVEKDKKEFPLSKNEELQQKNDKRDTPCKSREESVKLNKNKNRISCGETNEYKIKTVSSGPTEEKLVEIGHEIENQINAVSSTSAEEVPMEATVEICKTHNIQVDDNMPSSSGNISFISTEKEGTRHEFLNKFVQEIFKPNANKENILNLLSQILDKNKLEFVKTVIEFATNGNEIRGIVQTKDIEQNLNEKSKIIHKTRTDEEDEAFNLNSNINPAKQKCSKKKRNELDRLNDDIRDMFISKGVLTATGKRMCTLMAQTKENENNLENYCNILSKNNPGNVVDNAKPLHTQAKMKAKRNKPLISTNIERKVKPLRRSLRQCKNNTLPSHTIDDHDEIKSKVQPISNDNAITLSIAVNLSPQETLPEAKRQMPMLKPNTPMKFPEEELFKKTFTKDLKNFKFKQILNRQKLKVTKVKKKIYLANPKKGKITEHKTNDRKFANLQALDTNCQQSYENEIANYTESIKNTNVNWHYQSKYANWCIVCQKRLLGNSSLHYKLHHGENYISRFAPIILQKYKQGKLNNPLFGVRKINKPFTWFYRCPFCLKYFINTITQWLSHFQEHTTEYRYECSRCFCGGPKIATVRRHCNYKCKGAKVTTTTLRNSQTNCIKAHVCHLCNFVQLKRCNLQRHYLYQHDFEKKTVDLLGCTITLINTDDTELVEEFEAASKEEEAWKTINAEEQVIDVDADNTEGNFEECNNQTSETEILNNLIPEFDDLQETVELAEFEKYDEQDLQDELLALAAKAAEVMQKYTEASSDMPGTIDNFISCEKEQHPIEKENVLCDLLSPTVHKFSKDHESDKSMISNEFSIPVENTECLQQSKELYSAIISLSSSEEASTYGTIMMSPNPCLTNTTGSIFITSRNSSNSPINDANCLARSLMEIEQSPPQNILHENNASNISIADRISQHFKNLEGKSQITEEIHKVSYVKSPIGPKNSGSSLNEVIADEDDADWEDIEVMETSPTAQSTVHSSKLKGKRFFQKFMFKSKKSNPSLYYFSKKKTKEPICNLQSAFSTHSSNITCSLKGGSLQTTQLIESGKTGASCNTLKPVINIIDDLLPDSPCNDPLELVPELAPLEPLQDLNDISSILNVDICANQHLNNQLDSDPLDNQTSIEDALDFIHEQQAQEVEKQKQLNLPTIESTINCTSIINRVQHVGFSTLTENEDVLFKFYCLLNNCTFLYSSDITGLENHVSLEHAETTWNGFCVICDSQILKSNEEHSIKEEIKHLIEKHSKVKQKQEYTETVHNQISENEKKGERPRIKIRRLTGDCLSATIVDASSETCEPQMENMLGALLSSKSRPPTNSNVLLNSRFSLVDQHLINNNSNFLKISEVVSLRNSATLLVDSSNDISRTEVSGSKLPLSKITNICNSKGTISDGWFENSPKFPSSLQSNRESLSPEPIVVSETVPVGQARSGNFVITQTISAQYDGQESQEPELGINISISSANLSPTTSSCQYATNNQKEITGQVTLKQFRCMGKGCKYSTRVPVAMSDHLRFHEKRNLSLHEDYLHCSFCLYSFESVKDYMKHMEEDHSAGITNGLTQSVGNNKTDKNSQNALKLLVCMAKGCNYSTGVPINIEEHLRQHENDNELAVNMEYLKCNFCLHTSSNVNTYMEHIVQHHYTKKKIVSIVVEESRAKQSESTNVESLIPVHKTTIDDDEETYKRKLSEALEDLVERTGLPDNKLYRCVVKNCITPLEETSFSQHVLYHTSTLHLSGKDAKFYYKCPHCTVQYQRPATLKAHIKVHARCRFFCYLCSHTSSNLGAMLKHFNENHWHTLNISTTVLLNVTFKDGRKQELSHNSNFQVAYTEHLDEKAVRDFGKKLIFNWKLKKATSKTHFTSDDIDVLPIQPIFHREINCGECEYRTKVRTNLYRHLQMHKQTAGQIGKGGVTQVANVDPINPVPCLNTNEKFFDKMTNLASSSIVNSINQLGLGNTSLTNTNICNKKPQFKMPYMYVLENKRYICGVSGCKYLTISDDLFRSHLLTLHESATLFRCPFCNEDICKRGLSTERIFAHFKFHGATLYRCQDCNYLHYLRFLVERHVNEKHNTQKVNIIKHERSKEEDTDGTCTTYIFTGCKYKEGTDQMVGGTYVTSESGNTQSKTKNKWVCNVCGHKTITMNQIQAHCLNEHGQKLQYQCVHCSFGSQHLSAILQHIDDKHNGKAREARNIFYRVSNDKDHLSTIDTRPLWQRNDPTRVRHIRGILMEDEEESEKNRQKLGLTDGQNDDDGNTNINRGNSIVQLCNNMNSYEFGCYYCSYTSTVFNDLKLMHWRQSHNTTEEAAVPFYFRLIKKFCCAVCRQFCGTYEELKVHLQREHKCRYYAADVQMAQHNTMHNYPCGYCTFVADSSSQLLKHYQRKGHQPEDTYIESNEQLYDMLKLGCSERYVQCGICQAIFANRVVIVAHAKICHPGMEGYSFRDLCDMPIYKCFLCSYSDVCEINTARHMCNHYEKFKVCQFCSTPQSSFNSYMQHCYGEHREDIQKFRELYPFVDIKRFLLQINVLLPNGLILNKRSLLSSQYGSVEFIRDVYEELYKISQQPPIPRLSLGRLVAKIGQESKSSQTPRSIGKRRCTIAVEFNEKNSPNWAVPKSTNQPSFLTDCPCSTDSLKKYDVLSTQSINQSNIPKAQLHKISSRRCTVTADPTEKSFNSCMPSPILPVTQNIVVRKINKRRNTTTIEDIQINDSDSSNTLYYSKKRKPFNAQRSTSLYKNVDMTPYSFYGQKTEELDLRKVFTKAVIDGIDTPVTIDKFKLLINTEARVVITKYDQGYSEYKHIKKACPASKKMRFT